MDKNQDNKPKLFMCRKCFHVQQKEDMEKHGPVKGVVRWATDQIKVCCKCGGMWFYV